MKEKPVILSDLEVRIMGPFWANKEISIKQVAEELATTQDDPGYSTVQTIAGRLEKKGAIAKTRKIGRAWLYNATVEKRKIVGRLLDDILGIFDGASNQILSHLVESNKIGDEELDDIRKMIEEREKNEKGVS